MSGLRVILAVLALGLCFVAAAGAVVATGGWYDDNGFHAVGVEEEGGPCAGRGGVSGPPTTRYDPVTGRWFNEYPCADGGTDEVDLPSPVVAHVELGGFGEIITSCRYRGRAWENSCVDGPEWSPSLEDWTEGAGCDQLFPPAPPQFRRAAPRP